MEVPAIRPERPNTEENPFSLFGWTVRILIAAAIGVLLFFAWRVAGLLVLAFGGVLLAVGLSALTDAFSRWTSLRRGWAFALVLLVVAGLIAGAVWLLAARLAPQLSDLWSRLHEIVPEVRDALKGSVLGSAMPGFDEVFGSETHALEALSKLARTSMGGIADVLLVLAIGIYVAADPLPYRRGLLDLLPPKARKPTSRALDAAGDSLVWWMFGQAIAMTVVGLLSGLGLWLIGLPLALSLGVIAGLLDFIPLLGPFLGAVPGVLIAFSQGPTEAFYAALVYLAVQQVEGNLIQPLVNRRAVDVQPAILIVAVIGLGTIFGIAGVIFGAPLTVVAQVFITRLYVEEPIPQGRRR